MAALPTLHTRENSGSWLVALAAITALALAAGLGTVFFFAPEEATMGVVQKIFYFHVPSALAAYAGFIICCLASLYYLLTGKRGADVLALAGAEVGVLFCTAVLISGPLWARKAWGTWWTGEPRLILTLAMALIYAAYLLVRNVGGQSDLTRKTGAILAIIGCANIPFVRIAVARWRGTHPQVITGKGGGLDPDMQLTLIVMFVAIALLFSTLLAFRVRLGLLREDAETLHREVGHRRLSHEANRASTVA